MVQWYRGDIPPATRELMDAGLLSRQPRQIIRDDLRTDSGIDIHFQFVRMTPENFREWSNTILEAALETARRYVPAQYPWVFGRFVVRLGRTVRGRASLPREQDYPAAKNTDPDVMVYGPGYEVPQDYFLIEKVEQILDIPLRYAGDVGKQRPYRVREMVISVRAGTKLA